jgi:hypothetical protein
MIVTGSDLAESRKAIELARKFRMFLSPPSSLPCIAIAKRGNRMDADEYIFQQQEFYTPQ